MKQIRCPNCKKVITSLRLAEGGTMFYDCDILDNGELNYEQDEFESNGYSEYFCPECNETIGLDDRKKEGVKV